MVHSTSPDQIRDESLKYLYDYCQDLKVPLGISCDNNDLSAASKLVVFKTFSCDDSLIDYANVPTIKKLHINSSQFYFKRILANAPWRIMVPRYKYHLIVRKHILNKGLRNDSYGHLFFGVDF